MSSDVTARKSDAERAESSFPRVVFETPVLRAIDERGRAELASAGRLHRLSESDILFREGDPADAFFVLARGSVRLFAPRRGASPEEALRLVRRGETFGEEAALPGAARRGRAVAEQAALVAEVPLSVFRRVAARSGADALAERELRVLRRAATRDLFLSLDTRRELTDDDLDLLLDAAREQAHARGERIFTAGERADAAFLVTHGLVQLQTEDERRVQVRAYLTPGDLFGEDEALAGAPRSMTAVALGDTRTLYIPASLLGELVPRLPTLLERLGRVRRERRSEQSRVVGAAAARTTQHVFRDLYRLQVARSLLVIDQESCVRCGHCAWTCAELHDGVARLVRRGDKVVTSLDGSPAGARSLLLPNSCQQCKNPACMIDCPTGAIGRDPDGDVFIREELCTGCGACAKACPWDNIELAPRAVTTTSQGMTLSKEVAVKCDLCRDFEAPGCVQACPTGSIWRLEPSEELAELGPFFGERQLPRKATPRTRLEQFAAPLALCMAIALSLVCVELRGRGVWSADRGFGLFAGYAAGLGCLLLAAFVVPKRLVRVFMKRRAAPERSKAHVSARPRSRLEPLVRAHVVGGLFVIAAVIAHAGIRIPATPAGALVLAFWIVAGLGVLGAIAYRALPRRLARLERHGALPEDLAHERERLVDRLHREASGRDELVKRIMLKVLLPYARALGGPVLLVLSNRTLKDEERRLRRQIAQMLQGRGEERLDGLDELVRIVVELRALPARRALTALLRGWLPAHALVTAMLIALLALHVGGALGAR